MNSRKRKLSSANNNRKISDKAETFADDEHPPILEPETTADDGGRMDDTSLVGDDQYAAIWGDNTNTYMLGDGYYVDNGILYQKPTLLHPPHHKILQHHPRMAPVHIASGSQQSYQTQTAHPNPNQQQANAELPLEETTNICCGLCGDIIPYEQFVPDHLPKYHPEVLIDGIIDLEEVPFETWLSEGGGKIYDRERPHPHVPHHQQLLRPVPVRSTRQLRRISQYRVNTAEMSIPELELALQKKMVEKMGRKVPVTLVDKLHAKCGICNTVISLNKKFEIVHLVRHFNAWHPSAHKCAGTWPNKELPNPLSTGKPLSSQDFAIIDPDPEAAENLQCIWCGMFMSNRALGMHFHEIHPEEVEVPKCNLCMQELLINARMVERFGEDFGVTLPDEHNFRSIRFKRDFKSEQAMERAIIKYLRRIGEGADPNLVDIEDLDPVEEEEEVDEDELPSCKAFQNSSMNCGRRAKPKRQFIMPVVRQAAPVNSRFVQAITHSHWKCKLCGADIYAAVISAGVIKHYKRAHAEDLAGVQLELCQARLDKISDGNMTMASKDENDMLRGICMINCQLCHMSFPMTPAFNICRAIRHIKMKHPEVMPEHKGGESTRDGFTTEELKDGGEAAMPQGALEKQTPGTSTTTGIYIQAAHEIEDGVIYATELLDYSIMEMLRNNYSVGNFDRVFMVYGKEIDQEIFILTMANHELDAQTVEEIVKVREPSQNPMVVVLNRTVEEGK